MGAGISMRADSHDSRAAALLPLMLLINANAAMQMLQLMIVMLSLVVRQMLLRLAAMAQTTSSTP